jgi:hypothetical protein
MATRYPDVFAALARPFDPGEVKTRSQAGRKFSYVTARTVANRLDEVIGPEAWWDDYQVVDNNSALCRLTIRLPDGSTVTKCDAGGAAGMADAGDDDKSMLSDAFKRAAARWGVGRYLYGDGVPRYAAAGEPEAEPGPSAPVEAPDPARLREKGKALAEIAKPYERFAADTVQEAREAFYALAIDRKVAVPPEVEKKLPNIHQLGGHLTKWVADQGLSKRLPPGSRSGGNNRRLVEAWTDAPKIVRGKIRLEARRYLAAEFDEVYRRLAGQGDAYEAPAEQAAEAG